MVDAGGYIFNTEAHPIDPGALHCCQHPHNLFPQKKSKLYRFVPVDNRRKEDPTSIKFFEDDVNNIEENNQIIKIEKLTDFKRTRIIENVNNAIVERPGKSINISKEESFNTDKDTDLNESSDHNMKVAAPPSVMYKADDSENTETFATITKINKDPAEDVSNKNESMRYKDPSVERKLYFDPQMLMEKIRKKNLYPSNSTAKEDYQLLSCPSQPFLQRISIVGEFF